MTNIEQAQVPTKRPRRMAREPNADTLSGVRPKRQNKTDIVLELLARSEGVTLDQLGAVTGWLPHTCRAAFTGLRKKGHAVTSDKTEDSPRVYRAVTA